MVGFAPPMEHPESLPLALLPRADARVSILWGDPIGESGGGRSSSQTRTLKEHHGTTRSIGKANPLRLRVRIRLRGCRGRTVEFTVERSVHRGLGSDRGADWRLGSDEARRSVLGARPSMGLVDVSARLEQVTAARARLEMQCYKTGQHMFSLLRDSP